MSPHRTHAGPGWVMAATAASTVLALTGCSTAASPRAAVPSQEGFAWFVARAAPAGWSSVPLPGREGTMSYPSAAHRVYADPGAVAVATGAPGGLFTTYLNATPQQGSESPANWSRFRISHLRHGDDATRSVTLLASADHLQFTGGRGSCVLDDYVTKIGGHHYREIACLVAGKRGSSVLVAAALLEGWAQQRNTMERAVDSYVTS